ncbi:MAG: hypothetical protein ACTSQE_13880 [Candidatus Heimdallarchaeaceae archaeon]
MFKRMDLPKRMNEFLVSITPLLGISGDKESATYFVVNNYISLSETKLALQLDSEEYPPEISLNILRKNEDPILINAYQNKQIKRELLIPSKEIACLTYGYSILTLETKFREELESSENLSFGIYEIVHVTGDFALDPDFNDDISIAKSIETMAMTAVDSRVVYKKVERERS